MILINPRYNNLFFLDGWIRVVLRQPKQHLLGSRLHIRIPPRIGRKAVPHTHHQESPHSLRVEEGQGEQGCRGFQYNVRGWPIPEIPENELELLENCGEETVRVHEGIL